MVPLCMIHGIDTRTRLALVFYVLGLCVFLWYFHLIEIDFFVAGGIQDEILFF